MLNLFPLKKKKQRTLEERVLRIQEGSQVELNDLINEYKPFIAKTVSSVCKRYIHESDDEFSIGLIAFNEAIHHFNDEKGRSLLSFAETIIQRRVIDYIRQQARHQNAHIDDVTSANENEYVESPLEIEKSIATYRKEHESEKRKDEIVHFTSALESYDLSFNDLVKHTPKHKDARKSAMKVAQILANSPSLISTLEERKKLPIKEIESKVEVSRKTIERNRKYIIAIALVLIGDYLYLKDYVKEVLED